MVTKERRAGFASVVTRTELTIVVVVALLVMAAMLIRPLLSKKDWTR